MWSDCRHIEQLVLSNYLLVESKINVDKVKNCEVKGWGGGLDAVSSLKIPKCSEATVN